jgi:hypothetical protein
MCKEQSDLSKQGATKVAGSHSILYQGIMKDSSTLLLLVTVAWGPQGHQGTQLGFICATKTQMRSYLCLQGTRLQATWVGEKQGEQSTYK